MLVFGVKKHLAQKVKQLLDQDWVLAREYEDLMLSWF